MIRPVSACAKTVGANIQRATAARISVRKGFVALGFKAVRASRKYGSVYSNLFLASHAARCAALPRRTRLSWIFPPGLSGLHKICSAVRTLRKPGGRSLETELQPELDRPCRAAAHFRIGDLHVGRGAR